MYIYARFQRRLTLILVQFTLYFFLLLELEKDEEYVEPRLKLNYVGGKGHYWNDYWNDINAETTRYIIFLIA